MDINKYLEENINSKNLDELCEYNFKGIDLNLFLKVAKGKKISPTYYKDALERTNIDVITEDDSVLRNIIIDTLPKFDIIYDIKYLEKFYKLCYKNLTPKQLYNFSNYIINLPGYLRKKFDINEEFINNLPNKVLAYKTIYDLKGITTFEVLQKLKYYEHSANFNDFIDFIDLDFFCSYLRIPLRNKNANKLINKIMDKDLDIFKTTISFINFFKNIRYADNEYKEKYWKKFIDSDLIMSEVQFNKLNFPNKIILKEMGKVKCKMRN